MRRIVVMLSMLLLIIAPGATLADDQRPIDVDIERTEEIVSDLDEAADPDQVFSELSEEEQASVMSYLEVDRIETTEEYAVDRNGASTMGTCWQLQTNVRATNAFGYQLWRFTNWINWCGDGSVLTSHPTHGQTTSTAPFWTFNGLVGDHWHQGTTGWTGVEMYHMGYFQLCYTDVGCVDSVYPWIHQKAMGSGAWWSDWGG